MYQYGPFKIINKELYAYEQLSSKEESKFNPFIVGKVNREKQSTM